MTPAGQRRKALAKLGREQRLTRRLEAIDGTLVSLNGRSKMRNQKTVYRGVKYDSLLEAEYAAYLDSLMLVGKVVAWERQVHVILLDGPKARDREKMIVDFKVWFPDGRWRYEDVKGRLLPVFLHKVKHWKRRVQAELWIVTKPKDEWVYRQMADGILPAWLEQYR